MCEAVLQQFRRGFRGSAERNQVCGLGDGGPSEPRRREPHRPRQVLGARRRCGDAQPIPEAHCAPRAEPRDSQPGEPAEGATQVQHAGQARADFGEVARGRALGGLQVDRAPAFGQVDPSALGVQAVEHGVLGQADDGPAELRGERFVGVAHDAVRVADEDRAGMCRQEAGKVMRLQRWLVHGFSGRGGLAAGLRPRSSPRMPRPVSGRIVRSRRDGRRGASGLRPRWRRPAAAG